MAKPDSRAETRALARALAEPHLVRHGEFDCTEWLATATAEQLRQLSDIDLWRAERPGREETFDAARFGDWIEALAEADPELAAERLTDLSRGVVIAGLSHHVRVFDRSTTDPYEMLDGTAVPGLGFDRLVTADFAGYLLIARITERWDAIVATLAALEEKWPDRFHDIMHGVRALSNSATERDAFHDLPATREQVHIDLGLTRDDRRTEQGYVAVGEARVFLETARRGHNGSSADDRGSDAALVPAAASGRVRFAWLSAQLQYLEAGHSSALAARNADLAYLTNTLMSGCALQGRPFAPHEAAEVAAATCNLALEQLAAPAGFLATHDLMHVFQIGWTMLHDDVAMRAADGLAETLVRLRCADPFVRSDLAALRRALIAGLRVGRPWQARPHMDVIASLDAPAWAALIGLIDECPVRHAAIAASRDASVLAVDPRQFTVIADLATLTEIERFIERLPDTLTP